MQMIVRDYDFYVEYSGDQGLIGDEHFDTLVCIYAQSGQLTVSMASFAIIFMKDEICHVFQCHIFKDFNYTIDYSL